VSAHWTSPQLTDTSITASPDARPGKTTFADWLADNHK
jgi:hypothetical protein